MILAPHEPRVNLDTMVHGRRFQSAALSPPEQQAGDARHPAMLVTIRKPVQSTPHPETVLNHALGGENSNKPSRPLTRPYPLLRTPPKAPVRAP